MAALRPLSLAVAVVLLGLVPVHLSSIAGAASAPVAVASGAAGIALLLIRFGLLHGQASPRAAFVLGFLVLVLPFAVAGLHLILTDDARQVAGLVILVIVSGFVVVSFATLAALVLLASAAFALGALEGGASEDWIFFGVALGLSVLAAALAQVVRVRSLHRLLESRLRDERHKTTMGRSFQQASESELRFRRLSEASFEGIFVHDRGRVLDVNDAGAKLLGLARQEIVGRDLRMFLDEGETGGAEALLSAPVDQNVERTIVVKGGREVIVELRGRTIPYAGVEARVVAVRDVTERRLAERERSRLRRQLERILDSAGEGIFGQDLQGVSTFVNPAAARLTGWRQDELTGRVIHRIIHHTRPDGRPLDVGACAMQATARDGEVRKVTGEVFWRKDGSSFPVEYVVAPMVDQDRRVGVVVVFNDITERREVERMKDEIVSVVSHELRTPLTSIHGALRLVATGRLGELPPEVGRMVDIATSNTDRLVRLVNDLLDVERLRSGKAALRAVRTDALVLIHRAAETMRPMAHEAGVAIVEPAPEPALHLVADPDRVQQALVNLLSNAIKFSPRGSAITMTVGAQGPDVRFAVRDEGPGIPPDRLDRLFERFSQVDASDARAKGGTGLGLSICKAIVERHDGTIAVDTAPGKGSTFFFTLPVRGPEGA